MRRFVVSELSMTPALQPGDELVATRSIPPRAGSTVVFEHPDRPGFWLVKRVGRSPHPIPRDHVWVVSDNREIDTADSRRFGPVPKDALLTVVERLDATTFVEACELLGAEDPDLGGVVATVGVPEFWHRSPGFSTLVLLILEQQVSLESGAAMFRRLLGELGPVTAPSLLNTGEAGLRALGVTRQKTGYLLGLSTEVIEGDLDLEGLADMSVEDARDRLLRLHGIGRWTADAYLLSALRHPDVFPVGDRALQVGAAETLGLKTPPDEGALEILAEPWRPIRAVAARLIWHDYLTRRGRTEPELPQHITRAQA